MLIDIILLILIFLAVIKGLRRGLIVAIFSFIAVIVGLAAAIKLSAVVAAYLGNATSISQRWLPVISFIVVFIGIILLIRLAANAIEKLVQAITLGWLNRIGGVIFYVVIYMMVYSILLFYAEKMSLLKPETINNSLTWNFIRPWGPFAIDSFGKLIPLFRDMFNQLEQFFEGVGKAAPATAS